MKIAVISPINRSGASVVASVLAQASAITQELRTVLTYTSPEKTLPVYLDVTGQAEDRTRSISQVVKLLQADAMTAEDLDDYAIKLDANCYMMDTVSDSITRSEALQIQKYVFEHMQADLVFCDVSEAIDEPIAQELISISDAVCFVLNPDTISIDAFNTWKSSEYWPKDKKYFVVINRYDDAIYGVRQYAKQCGIEVKNTCKLHYNPFIVKSCNEQFLKDIVPYSYTNKDYRVIDLRNDIKELMSWIAVTSGRKLRWVK